MTMQFDAVSRHSPSGSTGWERLAPMPLFLTGMVFLVAVLLRQMVPLNTDVSWLLVVCERMLDRQQLYRDILEINPPMAAFAYLPGVALARVLERRSPPRDRCPASAACGRLSVHRVAYSAAIAGAGRDEMGSVLSSGPQPS